MFFKSHKLFSIGQLAKMHGINKKTLMWYDEVGLLKPALIKSNGYRYYSVAQSFNLEIILMLRELEVPIAKIKDFLSKRTPENLNIVYALTLHEVEQKLARLQRIEKHLQHERYALGELLNLDLNAIEIVTQAHDEYLTLLDLEEPQEATMEDLVEAALTLKQASQLEALDFKICAVLDVKSIQEGKFDNYRYAFSGHGSLPKGLQGSTICKQQGRYLRAYYQGPWEGLEQRYAELLAYVHEHQLPLADYAYEVGINEPFIDTIEQYITKIEIALA